MPIPQPLVGGAMLTALCSNPSGIWGTTQLASLGLKSATFSRHMEREPIYPANPRNDCPKLRLRLYVQNPTPGPSAGISLCEVTGSAWYYRLQVPGQNHQQLLIPDLELIASKLVGAWRPGTVAGVAGIHLYGVWLERPVVHDALHHDFDDPSLRVSVGEVPFRITGRLQ